jgi:hypothetical protein
VFVGIVGKRPRLICSTQVQLSYLMKHSNIRMQVFLIIEVLLTGSINLARCFGTRSCGAAIVVCNRLQHVLDGEIGDKMVE